MPPTNQSPRTVMSQSNFTLGGGVVPASRSFLIAAMRVLNIEEVICSSIPDFRVERNFSRSRSTRTPDFGCDARRGGRGAARAELLQPETPRRVHRCPPRG